jgi:hypothetical protein
VMPLIQLERSDARNKAASATSSGMPRRWRGERAGGVLGRLARSAAGCVE